MIQVMKDTIFIIGAFVSWENQRTQGEETWTEEG